jgi:hypothetical protein
VHVAGSGDEVVSARGLADLICRLVLLGVSPGWSDALRFAALAPTRSNSGAREMRDVKP